MQAAPRAARRVAAPWLFGERGWMQAAALKTDVAGSRSMGPMHMLMLMRAPPPSLSTASPFPALGALAWPLSSSVSGSACSPSPPLPLPLRAPLTTTATAAGGSMSGGRGWARLGDGVVDTEGTSGHCERLPRDERHLQQTRKGTASAALQRRTSPHTWLGCPTRPDTTALGAASHLVGARVFSSPSGPSDGDSSETSEAERHAKDAAIVEMLQEVAHNANTEKLKRHQVRKKLPIQSRRFVDYAHLVARAGNGGNGCTSFWKKMGKGRRTRGPDGGNGGHGGDVVLEAVSAVQCLSRLPRGANAEHGAHGKGSVKDGHNGKHRVVQVPVGTIIYQEVEDVMYPLHDHEDVDWDEADTLELEAGSSSSEHTTQDAAIGDDPSSSAEESGGSSKDEVVNAVVKHASPQKALVAATDSDWDSDEDAQPVVEKRLVLLGDLDKAGEQLVVAAGGRGGLGNKVTASKPGQWYIEGQKGEKGPEVRLRLELKVVADIGFVGAPNAGKSTLLGAITAAEPEVAAYPFTTLRPFVGSLHYDDFTRLILADIPGLVEGAHANKGLGHKFLRHIERCEALLVIVDCSASNPELQLASLLSELEQYKEGLATRVGIVLANKMDLSQAEAGFATLQESTPLPVIPISAKEREGLEQLLQHLHRFAKPW